MNAYVTFLVLLCVSVKARKSGNGMISIVGPSCPLPEHFVINELPMKTTLPPILVVNEGSCIKNFEGFGVSSLLYNVSIDLSNSRILFDIKLPTFKFTAKSYKFDGHLTSTPFSHKTFPSGVVSGSGNSASGSVSNFRASGSAGIRLSFMENTISCQSLEISNIQFDSIKMDFSNGVSFDGLPYDWNDWSNNIKKQFDSEYLRNKDTVVAKVLLTLNNYLASTSLMDLYSRLTPKAKRRC